MRCKNLRHIRGLDLGTEPEIQVQVEDINVNIVRVSSSEPSLLALVDNSSGLADLRPSAFIHLLNLFFVGHNRF